MEDSPLFNAGKGAVFTHDGLVELDAYSNDKPGTVGCVALDKEENLAAATSTKRKHFHAIQYIRVI